MSKNERIAELERRLTALEAENVQLRERVAVLEATRYQGVQVTPWPLGEIVWTKTTTSTPLPEPAYTVCDKYAHDTSILAAQ